MKVISFLKDLDKNKQRIYAPLTSSMYVKKTVEELKGAEELEYYCE